MVVAVGWALLAGMVVAVGWAVLAGMALLLTLFMITN